MIQVSACILQLYLKPLSILLLVLIDARAIFADEKLACSWGAKRFGWQFSSSSNVAHLFELCFSLATTREFPISPTCSLNSFLTTSNTTSPYRSHHDLKWQENFRASNRNKHKYRLFLQQLKTELLVCSIHKFVGSTAIIWIKKWRKITWGRTFSGQPYRLEA